MAEKFTSLNLSKIKQLYPRKLNYHRVRNLDYVDRDQRLPQSFAEYRVVTIAAPIVTEEVPRPSFGIDLHHLQVYSSVQFPKGKVLILVNYHLYPAIATAISQYIKDLADEGYFATAYRISNGTAPQLRSFIASQAPLCGILAVGNLPVAWFEMADDFNGEAEFPCDLYYMDLDGDWRDPDNDGMFSEHPTAIEPELWIGRLWTPTANGNDAELLTDYFRRNHLFRKGQLGYSDRALTYIDDDWRYFGDCCLDYVVPATNIEIMLNPNLTDGDRFKAEINQHLAWAQVCAHSSPLGHSFKTALGTEWVPNTYFRDINPPDAYFYNLFACSNARFTQPEYMAGWYLFDKRGGSNANGLAVVGSTKTGAMLIFENFYGPMSAGMTIGEAFVQWWRALGPTHELAERRWYYGLTLLGDPTLNWWTGVVPTLRSPFEADMFDHFPRRVTFCWDPIGLPGATYTLEIDAFGARLANAWTAETGQPFYVSGELTATRHEYMFGGPRRGRWRVRAKVHDRLGPWSDWRYFKFTK